MENKIERLMSIDFESETTYGDDDKYIKTRIKTYKDSIITNVYDKTRFNEVLEEKVPYECFNNNPRFCYLCIWKYYPQKFLEEYKYVKAKNYINNELKLESDIYIDSDIYI